MVIGYASIKVDEKATREESNGIGSIEEGQESNLHENKYSSREAGVPEASQRDTSEDLLETRLHFSVESLHVNSQVVFLSHINSTNRTPRQSQTRHMIHVKSLKSTSLKSTSTRETVVSTHEVPPAASSTSFAGPTVSSLVATRSGEAGSSGRDWMPTSLWISSSTRWIWLIAWYD